VANEGGTTVKQSRTGLGVRLGLRTVCLITLIGMPLGRGVAAPSTLPSSGEPKGRAAIEKLIGELEAGDFQVRRAAQLRLNSLGGDALSVVEGALADAAMGPEAQNRLRAALPFLKARARREGPERARLAWKFGQIRSAYDVGPDTSPRWDKEAREAIDLFTKLPGNSASGSKARTEAIAAFAKAAQLGCEDPLFLTMYHLTVGEQFGRDEGPVGDSFDHVIRKVQRAKYPPIVKVWAAQRYTRAVRTLNHDVWQQAILDFGMAAKEPGLPPTELSATANQMFDAIDTVGSFDVPAKDMLYKAYKAAAPGTHGALLVEGRVMLDMAWKNYARSGWGRNVPAANWNGFSDYLAKAAEALEAAWKLDPTDARPAALLITCQLGDKGGQRAGVETWFARAVEADPDCVDAYGRKMYTLNPWWYGDGFKDVISFGRECLATENWRAGVPMMLVAAHRAASEKSEDAKAYYARPDVWADLSAVYEGQLVNFPDDALRRSELANAAAQSGRWDVVRAQFEILGDRAVPGVFGGKATMDYTKRKAARLGGATTRPTTTLPVGAK
jgi:hypothetical protein